MPRLLSRVFWLAGLVACTATATAQPLDSVLVEVIPGTDVALTFVRLPGGTFLMGSPPEEPGRRDDEGPQREVTVAAFYMAAHELIYDAWAIFRSRDRDSEAAAPEVEFDPDIVARPSPPYEDPAHGMGTAGHPAVGMTQWGALQFARWLSEKTGSFYRLPTEAEWEYACRAGSTEPFGMPQDSLSVYAWYSANSDEAYHPVGTRRPNAWGIHDLLGNVAEWTLDEYQADFYETMPEADPWSMPTRLHPRTVRGGAFDDDVAALRCGVRLRSSSEWKRRDPQIPKSMWWNTDSPFLGFRLVRPVDAPTPEAQAEFWSIVLGG